MMISTDAAIGDVLIGIVGNGLYSVMAQSGAKLVREIRGLISPPEPSLVGAIRTECKYLSESLECCEGSGQERLLKYLTSPEVESIVRQLFATSLVPSKDKLAIEAIRGEFLSSLSKCLDIDESRLRPFATAFLNALISGVEQALQTAIEKNVLSAHEAKSATRHRMLVDEMSNLQKNVAFLASKSSQDVRAILDFETKYREVIGCVHSHIKPPHLESGRRVPIDEIFVAPRLSWIPRRKTEQQETLPLPMFLSRLYRAVLLGNPGGGKSTVSGKICYDLATRYSERLFSGREITPALVVLREYGSQKKATNCSIVQFLEQQASSRYQVQPPPNAFEYLLLNGRLLLVFDGLDELLDSSYRQEITSNVEAFCKLYPAVPVLVTSREVGYEQAPLNEKVFELFRLATFDEKQVQEYADKWFARDEDYSPEQKAQKARAFFADSAFVPDLRGNPLMLGLMCNLYRAEGYIPRNRPEVYGKCSVMLFERWDKSRDIVVPLPFEEHIRPAMQDLAFWIYSNEELQGGVTENHLIEKTREYLCKWVFDDPLKATMAASDFIRFCTGRAWVFTDTGTTRDGERLFQFTHRTFLEYFTACYLVYIHPTPNPLIDALTARIVKGEWDVVAQLAFQLQSKQVHGAADELLGRLLSTQGANKSERWNVLSFAERTLEFLVPSPKMRRQTAREALGFWLSHVRQEKYSRFSEVSSRDITEHIGNLLLATAETRDTVADEIEGVLKEASLSSDASISALAAAMSLHLTHPLHAIQSRRQVTKEEREFWEQVSQRIVTSTLGRILEIAHRDWAVAVSCYWREHISLSEATADFGIPFLVVSVRSAALGDVWFYPPGYVIVDSVMGLGWHRGSADEVRRKDLQKLESLADVFLRSPTPWVSVRQEHGGPSGIFRRGFRTEREDGNADPVALSPDASFGATCILAVDVEQSARGMGQRDTQRALEGEERVPESMRLVLLGRLAEENRSAGVRAVENSEFSAEQREFLVRWINGDINLVEPPSGASLRRGPRRRGRRAS